MVRWHSDLRAFATPSTNLSLLLTGETEWTISGQCTGNADIPLTENGEKQSKATGKRLVGPGKLIDPAKLAHVFCSPRQRAVVTLDLLLGEDAKEKLKGQNKLSVTEDIREWDYGSYGLSSCRSPFHFHAYI